MSATLRDRIAELVSDYIDPDIADSVSDDALIRALTGCLDGGEAAAERAEALGGALVKIACTLVDAGIYTALDDPETIAAGVATLSTRRHALECDATQGCAPGCATVKA